MTPACGYGRHLGEGLCLVETERAPLDVADERRDRGEGDDQGEQACVLHDVTSFRLETDVLQSFGGASVDGGGGLDVTSARGEVALGEPDGRPVPE